MTHETASAATGSSKNLKTMIGKIKRRTFSCVSSWLQWVWQILSSVTTHHFQAFDANDESEETPSLCRICEDCEVVEVCPQLKCNICSCGVKKKKFWWIYKEQQHSELWATDSEWSLLDTFQFTVMSESSREHRNQFGLYGNNFEYCFLPGSQEREKIERFLESQRSEGQDLY